MSLCTQTIVFSNSVYTRGLKVKERKKSRKKGKKADSITDRVAAAVASPVLADTCIIALSSQTRLAHVTDLRPHPQMARDKARRGFEAW